MDHRDRAVLTLLKFAFPNCAAHFSWEKCEELAGEDTEVAEYLSALASLHEQQHTLLAHQ